MSNDTSSRTYRSSLRAEQAATTRLRVIDAAAELFASRGYGRTTLSSIAAAADVSIETVQAHGPKRSLLSAAVRLRTLGREGDEQILATPEAQAVANAGTPDDFARATAALIRAFNERTYGIWRAFASAAADDPAVDADWSETMTLIRGNVGAGVDLARSNGWVRQDVDVDELTGGMWILTGPETYEKLTQRLGWSAEKYEVWLARSIADLIYA